MAPWGWVFSLSSLTGRPKRAGKPSWRPGTPSSVRMTAVSGGYLIFRASAVLFSLFHQTQRNDPNQVILGHWWVHVQPSLSFGALPQGPAHASEAADSLSSRQAWGRWAPGEKPGSRGDKLKVSPKKAKALDQQQFWAPNRVQLPGQDPHGVPPRCPTP